VKSTVKSKKQILVLLGNQLFSPKILKQKIGAGDETLLFLREDKELCTHFKYHKQKITFFLTAMRDYADELRDAGYDVHYESFDSKSRLRYVDALAKVATKISAQKFLWFEVEDKFFEHQLTTLAATLQMPLEIWPSPMFLTTREQFRSYLKEVKRPFMKTFYERQRRRLKILVDEKMNPTGGQWSFDEDNRKPLPKGYESPAVSSPRPSKHLETVQKLVEQEFGDHPGDLKNQWLPTNRSGAVAWFQQFLTERLSDFGPYEDALSKTSTFVHHSAITPFLNTGLLTPDEIVRSSLAAHRTRKIPLNSTEGFIRQVIGWREFIRGIYQNHSEHQDRTNFFDHHRQLTRHWYDGTTGIEPLDDVIKKILAFGYAHHIERLMVVGSLMLLLEIEPAAAHRWFMEMFIDSSDWVMGPNVYGMALFSDGGLFATKPYFCGSNYYKKMGGYKTADWQDGVDGLYWSFIDRNQAFFLKNPRLAMMVRTLGKMPTEKKTRIYQAAQELRDRLTTT
jgi:deoxyribodipyrimidine photolyase-related protein